MLRPTAIVVQPIGEYKIKVEFDNGEQGIFDVKPYIHGSWYGKLREKEYFKQARTDGFTVCWPDGQDICPDELYEYSKKV